MEKITFKLIDGKFVIKESYGSQQDLQEKARWKKELEKSEKGEVGAVSDPRLQQYGQFREKTRSIIAPLAQWLLKNGITIEDEPLQKIVSKHIPSGIESKQTTAEPEKTDAAVQKADGTGTTQQKNVSGELPPETEKQYGGAIIGVTNILMTAHPKIANSQGQPVTPNQFSLWNHLQKEVPGTLFQKFEDPAIWNEFIHIAKLYSSKGRT